MGRNVIWGAERPLMRQRAVAMWMKRTYTDCRDKTARGRIQKATIGHSIWHRPIFRRFE